MTITLKNDNGVIKQAPTGFSWTTFFFGAFVPLFRGDLKYFAIMMAAGLLTFGVTNFYFMFTYNGKYIENILDNGFLPADNMAMDAVKSMGLMAISRKDEME